MQLERKVLAFGRLPSSKGDLYVPAGVKGFVQNAVFHNTGGSAETVVLNYHDGTSEHQWLQQSIGAGDTLTLNLPGEGDTIDAGGRLTGSADTADTVVFKLSGVEEGWPGYLASNLWTPPANPHPMDDEFAGGNLDDWAVQNVTSDVAGSFGLGQVDAYDTGFTTGNVVRVDLSARKSWLLMQPPTTSDSMFIYKPYTMPTNLLMWARLRFNMERSSIDNNDDTVGINFATDAGGGVPDTPSRVSVYLNESDAGVISALSTYNPPGGSATGFVRTTDVDYQGQALEYVAIHKLGNDYHTWAGTNAGNWIWITSYSSMAFTPDMIAIQVRNNSTGGAGPSVHGIDFIRFIETDNFLL